MSNIELDEARKTILDELGSEAVQLKSDRGLVEGEPEWIIITWIEDSKDGNKKPAKGILYQGYEPTPFSFVTGDFYVRSESIVMDRYRAEFDTLEDAMKYLNEGYHRIGIE